MSISKTLLTVLVICAMGAAANADTIELGPATTGSDGIFLCAWDDTFLTASVQGNSTELDFWGTTKVSLIAIKEMISIIEAAAGGAVTINSATLTLVHASGTAENPVTVDRITTDWLADAAGSNENDTERAYADSDTTTTWAGAGDFDAANDLAGTPITSQTWNKGYRGRNDFDVTALVQTMFTSGVNYGFAMYTTDNTRIRAFSSETTGNKMPSLTIEYTPVPEPATMGMLLVGGLGVLARRRRR